MREELAVPRGPLKSVVGLLRDRGSLVIRLPLDSADVDAFSLPFHDRPVVVLGSDKNDRARSRFDAAHELAHLVIHGDRVWGMKEVEQQAHTFAASLLMPAGDIIEELPERADWESLFVLKERWQVSLASASDACTTIEAHVRRKLYLRRESCVRSRMETNGTGSTRSTGEAHVSVYCPSESRGNRGLQVSIDACCRSVDCCDDCVDGDRKHGLGGLE